MASLLGTVIPLGLGAAVCPAVMTVQLVTLGTKAAPLRRAWAIAIGFTLVAALACGLAVALAKGSHTVSGSATDPGGIVRLVAAGLLLLLGVATLKRAPKPRAPKPDAEPRLVEAVGVGAVLMATNLTSLVLLFPAGHDIGRSDVSVASKAVAFAILLSLVLLPALGPPLAVTMLGQRGEAAMSKLNGFTTRHRQAIGATICFVFAMYLGITGVEKLS